MNTLHIRIASHEAVKSRFLQAAQQALNSEDRAVQPSLYFLSYEDMHKVLAPARLAIVKTLAGEGILSIREVASRVDRDVQAINSDVNALINAGVIERTEGRIVFPYQHIQFDKY